MTQSFDEMPVKHVSKSFNQLLQEKLQVENTGFTNASEKPKRKFLRKGEGLARFRMTDRKLARPQPLTKKANVPNKSKAMATCASSNANSGTAPLTQMQPKKATESSSLGNQSERNGASALCLHSVKQMAKPTLGHFCSPKSRTVPNSEASKFEQEELRLFEYLEQQAANSSFCSTSSVVARLLGETTKMFHSNDFNKNTIPNTAMNNIPLKNTKSLSSQPEIVTAAGKYLDGRNTLLSNISAAIVPTTSVEMEHKRKVIEVCEPTNKKISPKSASKRLNFNSIQSSSQELRGSGKIADKGGDVGDSDLYDLCKVKTSDDSFKSLNSNSKKATVIDIAESDHHRNLSRLRTVSIGSSRQKAQELPETEVDSFQDSQAWSDCSCSSCEETDSESVSKTPNACLQQTIVTERKSGEDKCDSNKHENIIVQREAITFKSALLKERLTELENEIEIFKKENTNLRKLRKQYESDVANFSKEKKEYEKILKENSEKMQESIIAERKKLAREKQVFERYCKGVKSQPTRQEREEIQALKQQIAELQEELIRKDTRWSAMQVRMRDRMSQLNKQITLLKEENEKLKAEKAKVKRVRFSSSKIGVGTNTKVLHTINKQLAQLKVQDVENPIVIKNVIPRKKIPARVLSQTANGIEKKDEGKINRNAQPVPDLESKLKETEVLIDDQICNLSDNEEYSNSDDDLQIINVEEASEIHELSPSNVSMMQTLLFDAFHPTNEGPSSIPTAMKEAKTLDKITDSQECAPSEEYVNDSSETKSYICISRETGENKVQLKSNTNMDGLKAAHILSERSREIFSFQNQGNEQNKKENFVETIHSDGTREKNFSDGRQEVWYPNGNVKKLSSDKMSSKMIYYNGDVKEKYKDGIEKYYYAETKTWQTTYSDGREILEFPSGQVESKFPSGSTEISYPNGCTCMKHADGREEWTLTDGTIIKNSSSDVKELLFPNGQKEIHTEDHKRREYPDGTVKYIYPDGSQETRYASGRVRRKDKDGNLIWDSTIK